MAIDSRDKRAACVAFVLPFTILAPTPDGTITSVADRQQIAWSYRGVEAQDGYVAAGINTGNPSQDRLANAKAYAGVDNLTYDEAMIAMMRFDLSDDNGDIDELWINWLNLRMGTSETSLPGLKALAVLDRSVDRWDQIHDLTAIGT